MKYLEVVQKDFMGEQSHKVSDINTARHFLYAWLKAQQRAADHMHRAYAPVKQYVLVKFTDSDEVHDWKGFDEKDFENSTDDLDFVYLLFRHEAAPTVLQILKPYRLEPEMRETYVATINQPQGMYGIAIAFDRNAKEKITHSLLPVVDFYQSTCGRDRTKNLTDYDAETVISQIDAHGDKVRWPSNYTIYSRNMKTLAAGEKVNES